MGRHTSSVLTTFSANRSIHADERRGACQRLKEPNPDDLIAMHCSGTKFYEMAKQEMPGSVLLGSTGTRFAFGA